MDEPHVVLGCHQHTAGRKTISTGTLYDSAGRLVALAKHVWIAVDPDTFNARAIDAARRERSVDGR